MVNKKQVLTIDCRWILLLLMLLVGVVACVPAGEHTRRQGRLDFPRDPGQQARLNCFLVLKRADGPGVRMTLKELEVLVDNTWLPLLDKPLSIDAAELAAGQLFVAGSNIPPGEYRRLRLTVVDSERQNAQGVYEPLQAEPRQVVTSLTPQLTIAENDSPTVTLSWDVTASLQEEPFRPVVETAPATRQLLRDLVFVSCPSIDTVFVVRSDINWVVDSFGIKGAPSYLAIDSDLGGQRLYVLAGRDRMIKVFDLETYRLVDFFPVPLNDEPTYMTLVADKRQLFLLDENNGTLSRIDGLTGQILERTFVNYRPSFALHLPERNLLAVSLSLSQEVLLLDPLTFKETGAISTGSSPQGLLLADDQLYIAAGGDDSVDVVDLAEQSRKTRLPVGFGPRRLLLAGNQIYVSNVLDGSLSVLGSGQLGMVQEILGLGRPGELALDTFYRRLYVADAEAAALQVIDVNANRWIETLNLGAEPFAMVVVQ